MDPSDDLMMKYCVFHLLLTLLSGLLSSFLTPSLSVSFLCRLSQLPSPIRPIWPVPLWSLCYYLLLTEERVGDVDLHVHWLELQEWLQLKVASWAGDQNNGLFL